VGPTPIERIAEQATRYLFFTGKGGVGKTSVACAVGLTLAESGKRVLIVSTDPASNLDEVLETDLAPDPRPIPHVASLFASNLDPEEAAAAYREALVGPYRGILPDATIATMEEQLSGACTVEIAAFNEFAALVGDDAAMNGFDVVVFDTAPTGHTLRLLTLPTAWSDFIDTNTTGSSCLGPLAGLSEQRDLYARTVEALADGERTTLILVSRPDHSALREAARSSAELADLGIRNQRLVLNGVFVAGDAGDPIADALELRGREALERMPAALDPLPRAEVPLIVANPVGIDGLRALASARPGPQTVRGAPVARDARSVPPDRLADLVDDLSFAASGVIMTMGKGGVGKTTIAAAVALELARRGHSVHLSTTDPAAHVAEAVADGADLLSVSRIDPEAEVAAYREQVLAKAEKTLDPEALALLEEDLRSPCTEEIAVFGAFARVVEQGADGFVVLDTAPTGHTLLLLDASEAYHREVLRNATDTPPEVLALLPRLRDPGYTRVLIVTLAEATPVSEAQRLQDDLIRAGITPYAWVVNQSLALTQTSDPVLRARGANEIPHFDAVARLSDRCATVVPWVPEPPVGARGLAALFETTREADDVTRYLYFCERCGATFEVDVDESAGAPPGEATCPKCENPNATKAFAVPQTLSSQCSPGSGC
jgi:arsenite-transporting ATPase